METADITGVNTEGVKISLGDARPVVIDGSTNVVAVKDIGTEDTHKTLATLGNRKALSSLVGVFKGQVVDGVSVNGDEGEDVFNAIMQEGGLQWSVITTSQNIIKDMVEGSLSLWAGEDHGGSLKGCVVELGNLGGVVLDLG